MARLDRKVALITGAARGVGRSTAVRLAQEGADIIAIDIQSQIDTVPYPMATPEDMAQTVKEVEALGRRIVAHRTDVRDFDMVKAALEDGVARFGRLDIVSANAGIVSFGRVEELSEQTWQDMIDVNLTGVWHTAKAAIPHLRATGGGSIVLIGSLAGLESAPNVAHYGAAKEAVVGLMRTMANELAPDRIRVNSLHPSAIDNAMLHHEALYHMMLPDHQGTITREQVAPLFERLNALPVPWVESIDVSNAVLFLASDEARYITGVTLPVDAGKFLK